MLPTLQDAFNRSTILNGVKIVVLFFALGGSGAWCGMKILALAPPGTNVPDGLAGWLLLLASACLALPGMLLLPFSGGPGWRPALPRQEVRAVQEDVQTARVHSRQ